MRKKVDPTNRLGNYPVGDKRREQAPNSYHFGDSMYEEIRESAPCGCDRTWVLGNFVWKGEPRYGWHTHTQHTQACKRAK